MATRGRQQNQQGARGGRGGKASTNGTKTVATPKGAKTPGKGGFVVQGKVQAKAAKPDAEAITLSSDEEDIIEEGCYQYVEEEEAASDNENEDCGGRDEIQLLKVLPKSKSASAPPRPEETNPGIDVIFDSAKIFTTAGTADDYEEAWSLDSGVKQGYVKEYVEKNGLGMIFSLECGLILFSDKHLYEGPEGLRAGVGETNIGAGSQVSFVCYQVQSSKCRGFVTEDGFMRQAAAVWEPKPGKDSASQALLREVTKDSYKAELKTDFNAFISHIKQDRFLAIALVRARGRISGYLNHKIGIIETEDGRSPNCRVLFHSSDVYLFKTPVALSSRREPIDVLLPVGLNVSFDGRALRGDDPVTSEVPYQACAVFAGAWPKVPHPTLLPGGPGTYAPVYDGENTQDHTFYYLQLGLTENLDKKWRTFKESFRPDSRGEFRFVQSQVAIRSGKDHMAWKQQYSPFPVSQNNKRRHDGKDAFKKENHHKFKKLPPKEGVKVKKEAGDNGIKTEVKQEC